MGGSHTHAWVHGRRVRVAQACAGAAGVMRALHYGSTRTRFWHAMPKRLAITELHSQNNIELNTDIGLDASNLLM